MILRIDSHPELATVTSTNRWIMHQHKCLISRLTHQPVEVAGITDLAIKGWKFSGNAQRRTRSHVLFHGTFLCGLDLATVNRVLRPPSREPAYRRGRPHQRFLRNLPLGINRLREALREHWQARKSFPGTLAPYVSRWMEARYGLEQWHRRL